MKPILIVKTATSYDDLPDLCQQRGDEVCWFAEAGGVPSGNVISVDAYKGDPLPDPATLQAIIVTGSIDMISDDKPWMRAAEDWLRGALEQQVPILGVCFGHHLLALAVGGTVGQNPNGAEFGVIDIEKAAAADEDPLFKDLPQNFGMHVFHYESILTLPKNAVLLAKNTHDTYQAFRYGKNAWGVQFHPEFDPEIMDHAIDVYQTAMQDAGYDIARLRRGNVDRGFGKTLLQNFVKLACS